MQKIEEETSIINIGHLKIKFNINNYRSSKPPRILGFTSTLIDSDTENIKTKLTELEQIFNATIKTKYEENAQM